MANRELHVANLAETILASGVTSSATGLSVNSSLSFPGTPFAAVLDAGDNTKAEVVIVTNVSGTTWTVTRGQDGTSAATHDAGAVVALVPVAAHWADIHDRVEAHDHSGGTQGTAIATGDLTGHDKAAHDALNIDADTVDGSHASDFVADADHTLAAHKSLGLLAAVVGLVAPYAGSSAPSGWLMCDGSAVSRTTYADLFSAIGTAYGSGDGSTTFNIPDLRDNFPVGAGSTYSRGDTGGAATHTLTTAELPSHTHTGPSHSHGAGSLSTGSAGSHDHDIEQVGSTNGDHTHTGAATDYVATTAGPNTTGPFTSTTAVDSAGSHTHSVSGSTASGGTGNTGSAGSGDPHENRPPYLALNFIVFAGA